jgi:hypothetical protein
MKENWKTTAIGVCMIVGALCNAAVEYAQHRPVQLPVLYATVTAGVGLIKAADAK